MRKQEFMTSFEELVRSIEQLDDVLSFSEIAKAGQGAHGETIPSEKRPAQQFLAALKKADNTSNEIYASRMNFRNFFKKALAI